jgi:phage terminase large subunit-like protein
MRGRKPELVSDTSAVNAIVLPPANCDWRDEELWHRVNPGLKHGYPDLAGLRQFAREAGNRLGDRESFRQLNLNIWLDHSSDPFVDMATRRISRPVRRRLKVG